MAVNKPISDNARKGAAPPARHRDQLGHAGTKNAVVRRRRRQNMQRGQACRSGAVSPEQVRSLALTAKTVRLLHFARVA
jgi:hypothetical protein